MPDSIEQFQKYPAEIVRQIGQLGDLRPGSITFTSGRCVKPNCRCHQPGRPPLSPHARLTFKRHRK